MRLDQASSYLTTFWTPEGQYRWVRMPFGIKQAFSLVDGIPPPRTPLVNTEHAQMQTQATVYAMGLTQPELEQVSHACDINFTTQTLETIKTHTDPVLQTLQASIIRGWPENKQDIRQSLQPFWIYKEELTIDKGLIFKGNRVLSPAMMRSEFLTKIHTIHTRFTPKIGHSGIEASLRKTHETVQGRCGPPVKKLTGGSHLQNIS